MKINKKVYESNISLFNVLKYSDTDLEGNIQLIDLLLPIV